MQAACEMVMYHGEVMAYKILKLKLTHKFNVLNVVSSIIWRNFHHTISFGDYLDDLPCTALTLVTLLL